jgi:hypothetical protein
MELSRKIFIGIDPGKTGAIAAIDETGEIVNTKLCPYDIADIPKTFTGIIWNADITTTILSVDIFVEKIGGRPGESRSANTTFVKNFGVWLGVAFAFVSNDLSLTLASEIKNRTVEQVAPRTWQAVYGFDCFIKNPNKKKRVLELVVKNFGREKAEDLALGKRGGVLDGICDALLIANYGRLKTCDLRGEKQSN